ncbi:MAG: hypothetical protein EXS36_06605 [Pedosphaera sp.]|nr:hypothetical protein [Pedosphaera sp.]
MTLPLSPASGWILLRPLRSHFTWVRLALLLFLVWGPRPVTAAEDTGTNAIGVAAQTQIRTSLDRMSNLLQQLPNQEGAAGDSPLADITAALREIMREAESFADVAASKMTNVDTLGVRKDVHSLLDEMTNVIPPETFGRLMRLAAGFGGDGKAIAAEVSAALKQVAESIREAKGDLAEADLSQATKGVQSAIQETTKALQASSEAARQSAQAAAPAEDVTEPALLESPKEPAPKGQKKSKSRRSSSRRDQDLVRIFQPLTVRAGESFRSAVVILNDATVDGTVTGDLVVIGGHVVLNGEVQGNLVGPLSSVELGPKAVVGGDVVAIGGELQLAEGAEIRGNRVTVPIPFDFGGVTHLGEGLKTSLKELVFKARPLSFHVVWVWGIWGALLVVHLLLALLFHRAVEAGAKVLGSRPASAFLMGLATFPLWLLLMVITSPTVVIPLMLLLALTFAIVFGKTTVCRHIGGLLVRPDQGSLLMGLGAVGVGALILTVAYLIPFFGLLAWALFTIWGLGAAILALWNAFRSEQPTTLPSVSLQVQYPTPPLGGSPSSAPTAPPSATLAVVAPPAAPTFSEPPRAMTANFLYRLGASFIDVVLLIVVSGWLLPFGFLLWVAYFTAMWVWRGTTIGGIVFGLRVVRLDGRPLDVPTALVRSLAAVLSVATCFLGYMWAAWDPDGQTWHDKLAGTAVLRTLEAQPLM